MHLLCIGENSSPTVILEAGGSKSSLTSRGIQSEMAEFARVCAYDRAGYGFSDPVNHGRTFDDITADLDALLVRAQVAPPYILVGHSMGGLMVRNYYRHHPEKVAGVVLLDAAEEEHNFARLDELRKEIVAEHSRPEFFDSAAYELEAYFSAPLERRKTGGLGSLGSTPLVVVTHGKPFEGPQSHFEDGWSEAKSRLAALSTDSEFVVAEHSGHDISLDQPELVVELVHGLVRKTAARK